MLEPDKKLHFPEASSHKASFIFEMGSYRSRTPPVSQNCDNYALKMLSEINTRDVG